MSEIIIGHENQINHLQHLVNSERVPHLFLFVGPSGVGKKRVAGAFAKMLGCNAGSTMLVEPDGASIKIDQAREVIEFCQMSHLENARMIIIDQMEKMNPQAANALLKQFEEPPPRTYFVLLAPSPSSVLTTIRSRALVLRFGSLKAAQLQQGLPDTPDWILQSSGGRFDRAEALQNEELLELRSEALALLKTAREGHRADIVDHLKNISPNRERAFWLVKFWREFLRDTWLHKLNLNGIFHSDLLPEMTEILKLTESEISERAEKTQKLENAMYANFDIQISLENYLVEMS